MTVAGTDPFPDSGPGIERAALLDADEVRWVERAAVLSWFSPTLIGAPADEELLLDSEGWTHLLRHSEIVRSRGGERRRLKLGPRRDALRALGDRAAMAAALAETPDDLRPSDRVQQAIDRLLVGERLLVERLGLAELYGLETVRTWFEGILPDLPPTDAILAARRRKELLAPHEALAGRNFYGRRDEREDLRGYINERRNERLIARLRGQVHGIVRWFYDNPPLVVHGPGGVGKSSLIANFVLEHAAPGFVFVDLDFGRPNIDSRSPETLLAEAARQIGAQAPGRLAESERVARDIERTIKPVEKEAAFLESAVITETSHAVELFVRFAAAALPQQNIPFVLDTFEEAMALGETHTDAVLSLTAQLQRALPSLRPIVCSRVRPGQSVAWLDIPLAEMEPQAATDYLTDQLNRRGLTTLPPDLVDTVVKRINRTPLALNIAAELLAQARDKGRDLRGEVAAIASKAGDAYLFDRLLKQIDGEDAHKLAFPGLIVRRLNPDLVLKVLKGPCRLSVTTDKQALGLLNTLAAKVSLIERREDEVFVHRPDVRRLMLRSLVENVPPATMEAIERAAITYFLALGDAESMAEAAYHLLRVGDLEAADRILADPSVADHLRLAVDEVDPAARLTLCLRLGITPSRSDRQAASAWLWERTARATSSELLGRGDYEGALAVLREKPDIVSAELDRIAAEALVGLLRWDDAKTHAMAGLARAKEEGNAASAIRNALTLARIGFGQNDLGLAEDALGDVIDIDSEAVPIDLRVHLAVARLRAARLRRDVAATRHAAETVAELVNRDVLGHIVPSTLRELTGELAYIEPVDQDLARNILVSALLRLGFEHEQGPVTDRLATELRKAALGSDGQAAAAVQLFSSTTETPPLPSPDADQGAWSEWVLSISAIGLGEILATLLKVVEGSVRDELLTIIIDRMKEMARHARERKLRVP